MSNVIHGDCLSVLRSMEADSVDLVLGSPPYGNQRRYGSPKRLFKNDDQWLDWTADRFMECLRVCRGLVAFVVEGYTRNGTFHPLPEMLTMEVIRRGGNIRNRNIYQRSGIMGGSPDEFAQHHEVIVRASSSAGRLPYAKPSALGHPPKCKPGGRPSHQSRDGRVNRPRKHQARGGSEHKIKEYKPPRRCKVSNVINCGVVGGGNMGSELAHKNEAPFCEDLAKQIIVPYCPPSGTVLDPFCGSGTTGAVAIREGRGFIGIDNRKSQVELTKNRLEEAGKE